MAPSRHDRHSVIDCALRLLDDVGLPDLSMRRIATELEVQPSALYWHFPNKQVLLAGVADRILAAVPEPDSSADPMRVAHAVLDALLTYRDGAEVVMSTYALRLGTPRAQRALSAALGALPDHDVRADAAFEFILGHATLLQQRMHAQSIGAVESDADDPTVHSDAVFDAGISALAGIGATR
ncbi:TetR family transcriptional regulator [Microbacterium sp. H1-D42]|uniref:TetR family transcriptional regulator n=1 Tax=Microbacterium sp. H1-D42 TaxID=2925844 RepID=UPI001F539566|nr:TetR family transcriptional regulator [Microbacterium sp. H1-D42]UNK72303.1 TetR family transcriptional regulator [Microbacterium sp. H1-D42]